MNRRTSFFFSISAAGLAISFAGSVRAQVLYDLVNGNESVLLHNGYIFLNTGGNAVFTSGTGSGNFNSFLRIQNTPNEEGFNTDAKPNSNIPTGDTKGGVSLQPNALQANVLGDNRPGTLPANSYFVFGLDGQESPGNGGSTISIDELSIYYRSTQLETDPRFPVAAPTDATDAAKLAFIRNTSSLVWSTDYNASNQAADHTLLIDYRIVGGGNGNADVIFAIPKSLFPTGSQFIYLVARLGYTTSVLLFDRVVDFRSESSFEEFGLISNAQLIPPTPGDPVPEASTVAAILVLTGGTGVTLWLRARRRRSPSGSCLPARE